MRTTTIAAILAVSTVTSSFAAAALKKRETGKAKKAEPVMIASAEPLPQLPPSEAPAPIPTTTVSEPTAQTDRAPTAPVAAEPRSAGEGFVLVVGSSVTALGGSLAKQVDVGG